MSENTSATPATPMTVETDVPVDVTMNELAELVQLFNESEWEGLEVELRGVQLRLGRYDAPVAANSDGIPAAGTKSPVPPAAAPSAEPNAEHSAAPPTRADEGESRSLAGVPSGTGSRTEVTSPVVGTFWVAPSPGEAPFVQIGDRVTSGQQLAIVEVMKLMNDISSPTDGRVVEVLSNNAELVEFGQVLFIIEGDDD